MAFEINHDWQGNLSTPRAKIGARVKHHLLLVLCAIWIFIGLIGHQPWKPQEPQTISIIKTIINNGSILATVPIGETEIDNPPLYYLVAAGSAFTLKPFLPMHDAARLANAIWLAATLILIALTGRELWGEGAGRQTTLVFMGSLGLIAIAHGLIPEIASLTGLSMGFYGLALAKRRPYRASLLLGCGIGIGFLATGVIPPTILIANALSLPIIFNAWRSKSYLTFLSIALVVASPWLIIWPLLCIHYHPELFLQWWESSWQTLNKINHLFLLRTMLWFAWPALPIAIWGAWRMKGVLLSKPKLQLIVTFFFTSFVLLGLYGNSEIIALPLLIPLTLMASGNVENLKRSAAGLLNWFGLLLFGIMGFVIWLGWIAVMTGWPAKLAERMQFLSGIGKTYFSIIELLAALIVTVIWIVTFNPKRSNRAAITDWAIGITMTWSLLMTLWLPLIDSAKSYKGLMTSLNHALPKQYGCINSRNMGSQQQALLEYYTDIHVQPFEVMQRLGCDFYLIQDLKNTPKIEPGPDWKLVWHGARKSDRRESFRLFKRIN